MQARSRRRRANSVTNRILGRRLSQDEILQPIADYKNFLYRSDTLDGELPHKRPFKLMPPLARQVGKRKIRGY